MLIFRFLVLSACVFCFAGCGKKQSQPKVLVERIGLVDEQKPEEVDAVYYWGVGKPDAVKGAEFLVFAGEAVIQKGILGFAAVTLPEKPSYDPPITAVLRFSPGILKKLFEDTDNSLKFKDAVLTRLYMIQDWAGKKVDLQIDGDCPTGSLGRYTSFLKKVKNEIDREVSVTCLTGWLKSTPLHKLAETDLPLYFMLYTMAPSKKLDDWGGEIPEKLWVQAMSDLKDAVEEFPKLTERMVIVLPVYSLVSAYDEKNERIWRGPLLNSFGSLGTAPDPEVFQDITGERTNAFGRMDVYQLLKTGTYGGKLFRAGTTFIVERFSLADWYTASVMVRECGSSIKTAIFHCGGISE